MAAQTFGLTALSIAAPKIGHAESAERLTIMQRYLVRTLDGADPPTLTVQAYQAIRSALMSGHLRPGQRLTMRAMSHELGMSVTPVREAIQLLITEHVLAMPGPKTVIVPRIDAAEYSEIILIRRALEVLAAEQAARSRDAALIDDLRAANARHRDAIEREDMAAVLTANKEFHFRLYRASGLPSLFDLIENQWVRVGPTLNLLYPQYTRSFVGNRCHDSMIEALSHQDTGALRDALVADLVMAERELLKVLSLAD